MRRFDNIRSKLINELCEAGELIRKGEDYFEDMGGHIVHESGLDSYISEYMKGLSHLEREELIARTNE